MALKLSSTGNLVAAASRASKEHESKVAVQSKGAHTAHSIYLRLKVKIYFQNCNGGLFDVVVWFFGLSIYCLGVFFPRKLGLHITVQVGQNLKPHFTPSRNYACWIFFCFLQVLGLNIRCSIASCM